MISTPIDMPEKRNLLGYAKSTAFGRSGQHHVEDIDIFLEMTMKLGTAGNYRALSPDELQDLFVVIHYKLSNLA